MHVALYGNVRIPRSYCKPCGRYALVLDGVKQCCDTRAEPEATGVRRISEPANQRRKPSETDQRAILQAQGGRCLYCDRGFGQGVALVWDHRTPWAYAANNKASNFAAACRPCNAWKSDHIFQTVDEARVYIAGKRAADSERSL